MAALQEKMDQVDQAARGETAALKAKLKEAEVEVCPPPLPPAA